MKKIISFLSSTRLMAVLFIVFSAAMAIATFVENEYNTDTAKLLIYNAKWFEAIMFVFLLNFIGNIKRYRLHKKEKWATLILHLSFILILIGAFVTRYISYEGVMPINEGERTNQILSEKTYLTFMVDGMVDGEMKRRTYEYDKLFSGALEKDNFISKLKSNKFTKKGSFNGIPFEVKFKEFIMAAEEIFIEDEAGDRYLKLVESDHGERHEHYVKEGTVQNIHNQLYAFNLHVDGAINFTIEGEDIFIESPYSGSYMIMRNQTDIENLSTDGTVDANVKTPFNYRSMYNLGPVSFVVDYPVKGRQEIRSNGDFKDMTTPDVLVLDVTTQGHTQEVRLAGKKGLPGVPQAFELGDLEFTFMYGSKVYTTPFEVQLDDFVAAKYPGTHDRFATFESFVTIIAPDETFDYHIYMNHVLDYKGFRFFQASYNYSSEEKRMMADPDMTVLSVNHDFWGTWITYTGYTLLYISMILIFFVKGTRFYDLKNKLNKIRTKKAKLTVITLFFGLFTVTSHAQYSNEKTNLDTNDQPHTHQHLHSQDTLSGKTTDQDTTVAHQHQRPTVDQVEKIILDNAITLEHADAFGKLVIQDAGGRMKPVNTFASELLRKVSKKDRFKGLDPDQVLLSMTMFPQAWFHVPIINVKKENDSIRNILGVPSKQRYIAMVDFFDDFGNYKLSPYLDEAYRAQMKSQIQKDFIAADERVNLLHQALSGQILTIFPIPNDSNNKWISYPELNESPIAQMDSTFLYTKNILPMYVTSLLKANETNDFSQANELLKSINSYQNRFGYEVLPSDNHIKYEILYNKYDIFKKLFSWYMYSSVLMFLLCIVRIFKDNKILQITNKALIGIIITLFIMHSAGLAARWYISGHAPWSDAYESMIYVAWATQLFGLIFGRKSELTIASTTFVTSMVLMVAHWSWMDPAISTLEPVLNSYWLMIHVAVIVASYGPFALGMILGIVALLLMIFTTQKNKVRMDLTIKELTYINEMALTVGLVLLTIGNFLGGQWANESWGRYWGWDPKETWALISIMIYAFVIHMRFVPSLRGTWIYNFISIIAFYSIIMTYFGVNFYLSGLHSYAKGDQVVTPAFIWWSVAIVCSLGAVSFLKYKKFYKK